VRGKRGCRRIPDRFRSKGREEEKMTNRRRLKAVISLSLLPLLAVLAFVPVVQAVEVGDKAPDFTLPSTVGDKLSLSQFLGKKNVLLEFYVLDFTPT